MTDTGGPKMGSGRKPTRERDWIRSESLRFSLRPMELEYLRQISEGWQIPVATVAWAIVHSQLSRWLGRPPEYGQVGLAIVAAVDVTRGAVKPDAEWDSSGFGDEEA